MSRQDFGPMMGSYPDLDTGLGNQGRGENDKNVMFEETVSELIGQEKNVDALPSVS